MNNIIEIVRRTIGISKILHSIYIYYSREKQIFKCKSKIKKCGIEPYELSTVNALVDTMSSIAKSKTSIMAHVICSGSSLLDSYNKIGTNDFVIGFNFAALLDIKFDLYFFELGSQKYNNYSKKQMMLICDKVIPNGGIVYFKNICDQDNDENGITKYIKGRFPILIDYAVPCLGILQLRRVFEHCLNSDLKFLAQYRTTAFTSIFVAYYLGFKHIVIHGLDYSGCHFYHLDNFIGNNKYITNNEDYKDILVLTNTSKKHATAIGEISITDALIVLKQALEDRGVKLYAGSNESPSAEILEVFTIDSIKPHVYEK